MGIDWILGVGLLLGGALAGGFLVRIFGPDSGRERQLQQELEQARKALSDYRGDVETHFRETAEAVNAMTESYRHVYDRLRTGASRLCGDGGQLLDLKPAPLLDTSPEPDPPAEHSEPATPDVAAPAGEDSAGATPAEARTEPPAEAAAGRRPEGEEASPSGAEDQAAQPAVATESGDATEPRPEEPRAPLDYVEGDEEERDKTLH